MLPMYVFPTSAQTLRGGRLSEPPLRWSAVQGLPDMDGDNAGRRVNNVRPTGTSLMKARAKPPCLSPLLNGQLSHDSTLPRHSTSDGSLDCVTLQLEPNIALGHGSLSPPHIVNYVDKFAGPNSIPRRHLGILPQYTQGVLYIYKYW